MLDSSRNGPVPGGAPAASEQVEMQAVRELLFGESQRQLDARIQRLESEILALEQGLDARLRELSQRFEELTRAAGAQHAALSAIGRSFAALSQQIAGGLTAGGPGGHVGKQD